MSARATAWYVAVALVCLGLPGTALGAGRIAYQGRLVMGSRGIVVMSDTGDNPVELPHPPGSDCITPDLSPDGTMLAYAAKAGDAYKIWVVPLAPDNSAAGEPKQLTTGPSDDEQPAWSPDGTRLAYVSSTGEQHALMIIALDTGATATAAPLGSDFRNACPHWSPDGSRLVFSSEGRLLIVNTDSGDLRQLADDGMYPSWSPDGRFIAFFRRKPAPALCVISPGGGEARVLTRDIEFFGETAWSPDGKQIAFKADKVAGQEGNLWVISAAGGAPRPLRSYGVAHGYMDWAPGPVMVAATWAQAPPPAPARPASPARPAEQAPPPARPSQAPAPLTPAPTPGLVGVVVAVQEPPKPPEAAPQVGPVRILSPADGAVVRGMVRVTVAKDEPGGYVSFSVDNVFAKATIAPFEMDWDTRELPDGEHTVSVTAYGTTGGVEGQAQARLEVRNAISEETLPQEGVGLRYRFKPKEKWDYEVQVRAQAGAKGEVPLPAVAAQAGTLEAVIAQRVEDVREVAVGQPGAAATPPATGAQRQTVATIITQVRTGRLDAPGAGGRLPQTGLAARSQFRLDGEVTPVASPGGGEPIALGNLAIVFPEQPVKLGDQWTAPMTVLPLLRSNAVARVNAEHRVEGLEWEGGHEALRIVSTFSAASLPVGLMGMSLEQVSGTRTTWFAYKEHRVLRIEDHLQGVFRQKQAQAALSAAGTPQVPPSTARAAAAPGRAPTIQRPGVSRPLTLRMGGGRESRQTQAPGAAAARPGAAGRLRLTFGASRRDVGETSAGGPGTAVSRPAAGRAARATPEQIAQALARQGGQAANQRIAEALARQQAQPTRQQVAQAMAQPAAPPSPIVHYTLDLTLRLQQ